MTRLALPVALIVATLHAAHADETTSSADGGGEAPAPPGIDRIRELYAKGDFEGVRRELLAQLEASHDPALLFALGQVELNLGNYAAAIDYYEKFIATLPSEDQIALAQQAIGAARMKLKQRAVAPPVRTPVPRRRWNTEDTGFVVVGGAAMLVGGGLLIYSQRLGNDRDGNLSDYDARVDLARTTRWTGAGVAVGGALLVGVTVLRWRLRPDGGDNEVTVSASASSSAAEVVMSGRW